MQHHSLSARLVAALFFVTAACSASAQGGFLGFGSGGPDNTPSLSLAPVEIALDVPTPVRGNDLALLLAQANGGNSLSELKAQSARKFSAHLQSQLYNQLQEHFTDEEVPLVRESGYLTLRSYFDVTASKKLNDLKNSGDSEIERGTLELSGDFHYRLENSAGKTLRERRINLADLRVSEKYQVKTPHSGGEAEDTTDAALAQALSAMVERLLDRVEDELEAGELRELAAL